MQLVNRKQQLIQEIEKASDDLIKEVLDFLLSIKNKQQKQENKTDIEQQLQEMAKDPNIKAEIANINREFLTTEMDGLNSK